MEDLLFGLLNGTTALFLLAFHAFGQLLQYRVFDIVRNNEAYQLGFVLGAMLIGAVLARLGH